MRRAGGRHRVEHLVRVGLFCRSASNGIGSSDTLVGHALGPPVAVPPAKLVATGGVRVPAGWRGPRRTSPGRRGGLASPRGAHDYCDDDGHRSAEHHQNDQQLWGTHVHVARVAARAWASLGLSPVCDRQGLPASVRRSCGQNVLVRRSTVILIAAVFLLAVSVFVWGEVGSNRKDCFAATADAGPPTTIATPC